MSHMSDIENDIIAIQDRMAARSDAISREVETVTPILNSFDQTRHVAGVRRKRVEATTREHPIASALSAISTLYMAAEQTGLMDRLRTSPTLNSAKDGGRRKLAETKSRSTNTAADLKVKSEAAIADASDALSGAYDDATELAERKVRAAKRQGQEAYRSGSDFVQQNPVALGLLAAGIGAAAASFFLMERKSDSYDDEAFSEAPKPLATPEAKAAMSAVAATAPAKRPARRKSAVQANTGTPKATKVTKPVTGKTVKTNAAVPKSSDKARLTGQAVN
jgi:hypothetical protein